MDYSINTLYDAAEHLSRPLLDADDEYATLYKSNGKAQVAFCREQSPETRKRAMDIINNHLHFGYLRERYFLVLGLHMGLELGSSNILFSD